MHKNLKSIQTVGCPVIWGYVFLNRKSSKLVKSKFSKKVKFSCYNRCVVFHSSLKYVNSDLRFVLSVLSKYKGAVYFVTDKQFGLASVGFDGFFTNNSVMKNSLYVDMDYCKVTVPISIRQLQNVIYF